MAPQFFTPKLLHQGRCCFVLGGEGQPQQYPGSTQFLNRAVVLDPGYRWRFSGVCCVATLICHRLCSSVGSSLQKPGIRRRCGVSIVWSVSFPFWCVGRSCKWKMLFLLQLGNNKKIPLGDLWISTKASWDPSGYLWKVTVRVGVYKEAGTRSYRVPKVSSCISSTYVLSKGSWRSIGWNGANCTCVSAEAPVGSLSAQSPRNLSNELPRKNATNGRSPV